MICVCVQFVSSLKDNLNAEVVLGTVTNVREASAWLGYTYLFVRMSKNPLVYGMSWEEVKHAHYYYLLFEVHACLLMEAVEFVWRSWIVAGTQQVSLQTSLSCECDGNHMFQHGKP
jgi:hypothetical protein